MAPRVASCTRYRFRQQLCVPDKLCYILFPYLLRPPTPSPASVGKTLGSQAGFAMDVQTAVSKQLSKFEISWGVDIIVGSRRAKARRGRKGDVDKTSKTKTYASPGAAAAAAPQTRASSGRTRRPWSMTE